MYLHKEKHSELVPGLLNFLFCDSNYGPQSSTQHTWHLRTGTRQRHMARPDALQGQAAVPGLGILAASRSHPSCLRKRRGILQALLGLAGISTISCVLSSRPAHLERFMLWAVEQTKPKKKC